MTWKHQFLEISRTFKHLYNCTIVQGFLFLVSLEIFHYYVFVCYVCPEKQAMHLVKLINYEWPILTCMWLLRMLQAFIWIHNVPYAFMKYQRARIFQLSLLGMNGTMLYISQDDRMIYVHFIHIMFLFHILSSRFSIDLSRLAWGFVIHSLNFIHHTWNVLAMNTIQVNYIYFTFLFISWWGYWQRHQWLSLAILLIFSPFQ